MKTFLLYFFLSNFMLVAISSCGDHVNKKTTNKSLLSNILPNQSNEELIIGEWILSGGNFEEFPDLKRFLKGNSGSLIFYKDKSFEGTIPVCDECIYNVHGKYEIVHDGKSIEVTFIKKYDRKEVNLHKIISLTINELVIDARIHLKITLKKKN